MRILAAAVAVTCVLACASVARAQVGEQPDASPPRIEIGSTAPDPVRLVFFETTAASSALSDPV